MPHASPGSVPSLDEGADFGESGWVDAPILARVPVPGRNGSAPEVGDGTVVRANKKGECRVVVYDLGEVQNGRPFLDVAAPAGTVVDVMAAPYLMEGHLVSPIVAPTYGDRIVLSGRRERWCAFYMPLSWRARGFCAGTPVAARAWRRPLA